MFGVVLKNITYCLVLIYCCIFVNRVNGQEISFDSWNMESGLSQNSVVAICQDDKGFIWLGTNKGLNRFDGKEFKIYKHNPSIPETIASNEVTALLFDSKKQLWVATLSGLQVFDARKQQFLPVPLSPPGGKIPVIFCMYEDSEGNIWVGSGSGIFRLISREPYKFEKVAAPKKPGGEELSVRSIFRDRQKNLWLASNTGLYKAVVTPGGLKYTVYLNNPGNPNSISSNIITSVKADKYNNIWVGTQSKGISLFHPQNESFTNINTQSAGLNIINNHIRVIMPDSAGNIWVGTQEGLSMLNLDQQKFTHYQHNPLDKKSLSQNSVHSIFIDNYGSVWVGTFFGGINVTNSLQTNFRVMQSTGYNNGLSNNVVSSVVTDNNHNVWIGTEGGGLNFYNSQNRQFTYYKYNDKSQLGSNLIKKVFKDADGNIWVGTHAGGLNLFKNNAFVKYFLKTEDPGFLRSEIPAIAEDADKKLWIGTQGSIKQLNVYKRSGVELTDISSYYDREILKNKDIKTIYPDSHNNIWIGTSAGVYTLPYNTQKVVQLNPVLKDAALNKSYITCIQEDHAGNIWIGIENGGLKKYNPQSKSIVSYSTANGLPDNNVLGVLEDNNYNIWFSTGNGLVRLHPPSGNMQVFNKADGLPSNTFNYNASYKDQEGVFYFGSYNGVVSFKPESFHTNTTKPNLVFTTLKTLNQKEGEDITNVDQLKLTHKQNVFTIEFALLNYIKPQKNKYAYMLRGFDDYWTETAQPSVTYMNLQPGKYNFIVKAANNDGTWSHIKELPVVVLPPFWKTWWAYLFYLLLFSTLLFFIVRFFYLRELIKKEEALHQSKLDFFTNVTHEIRTHLTLIMSPVNKMVDDRASDMYLQHQLHNIKKNADSLLRLSEELMDFRKAETENLKLNIAAGNIVHFVQEIYESFTDLSLSRNISIGFTHNIENSELYFDKEQLEKVFFNLITNAFKFTPDGGKIQVHITDQGHTVKVAVTDNGRGIAPEYKDKLFSNFFQVNDYGSQNKGFGIGLALSNKIAQLHGGSIEVDSKIMGNDERETSFAVILRKGNKHFNSNFTAVAPVVIIESNKDSKNVNITTPVNEENPAWQDDFINDKLLNILVVDDNEAIRNTISEILDSRYRIVQCENGATGWEYAIEHIPDLIISDVMMPEVDGLLFCNKVKTDIRTCHIPVILLTAKSTQQDHIEGLVKGADAYLTKPFNNKVLELNVRNLLITRERMREKVQQYMQDAPTTEVQAIEPEQLPVPDAQDNDFLKELLLIINNHMDDPEFNIAVLSRKIGMSTPVLYKKVKALTNLSVNDFIKSVKLKKAAELLQLNKMAVYEVCYAIGFQDRKYFSQEFKKRYGVGPKEYALSFRK